MSALGKTVLLTFNMKNIGEQKKQYIKRGNQIPI